jgi:hypothetical protein
MLACTHAPMHPELYKTRRCPQFTLEGHFAALLLLAPGPLLKPAHPNRKALWLDGVLGMTPGGRYDSKCR